MALSTDFDLADPQVRLLLAGVAFYRLLPVHPNLMPADMADICFDMADAWIRRAAEGPHHLLPDSWRR